VIVIGAGMAGLAAARKLANAGLVVTVLEAKGVVGGRVYTERSINGIPMDLGAGWIHGPDPSNPIRGLSDQVRAVTYETNDSSIKVVDAEGTDITATQFGSAKTKYDKLIADTRAYISHQQNDMSLAAALNATDPTALIDPYHLYQLNSNLEFDKGGWLEAFSAKNFSDDEKFPGKDVLFPGGYDVIPKFLAQGLDVRLNTPVSVINYSADQVSVVAGGATYTADYVICTATLGVLKAGTIGFNPPLPDEKRGAIGRMGMGQINKLFMVFDEPFWPADTQYFGYHSPIRGRFSYFLNYKTFAPNVNCLVTFGFGEQGLALERLSETDLIADVTKALKVVFGNTAKAPSRIFLTRWNNDPYAKGAYSFAAVNSGYADHVTLAQPLQRLLFAGEHTHEKYRATVHGAYLTGIREADRVLAAVPGRATQSEVDRFLNWAEARFANLFGVRGQETRVQAPYQLRSYRTGEVGPVTLAVQTSTNRVIGWLEANPSNLIDLGPLNTYTPSVIAEGY